MQRKQKFRTFAFFAALCLVNRAQAHPLDLGLLNLIGDGNKIHARLELNPAAGARLLKTEVKALTPDVLSSKSGELFRITIGEEQMTLDRAPCVWGSPTTAKIENPQLLSFEADAICPQSQGRLELAVPFLKNLDTTYRLLAMTRLNGVEHVGGADPLHPLLTFSLEEVSYGFAHFAWMGIEHIGVVPSEWHNNEGYHLPYGMDHILYVIALLLCGGTLMGFLRTITGFTLGHTTSLALVSFGLIRVTGSWIEASIALSIAFIAATALLKHQIKHRSLVTFGIGLVHGLGFANALMGLHLNTMGLLRAVIGFNVGVELGQAAIVLASVPFLFYFSRHDLAKRRAVPILSGIIILVSLRWFVLRAFG